MGVTGHKSVYLCQAPGGMIAGEGGWAFSSISYPWWGICHFLHAIKTNPHLYPGVGEVGIYFDWCIIMHAFLDHCTKEKFENRAEIPAITCDSG